MTRQASILATVVLVASPVACTTDHESGASNVALAEEFVSAFYSFDPVPLGSILTSAGDSMQDMLFYQGWAQGGNYIVMNRKPCQPVSDNTVSCSITVQDDLVLALGIDFDVTDTFHLTFEQGVISGVTTTTDDPQLYHDASEWVWENRQESVGPACDGEGGAAADPVKCVRNMLEGYREYARLNALTPRSGK